jgi:hypothetical protein
MIQKDYKGEVIFVLGLERYTSGEQRKSVAKRTCHIEESPD